MKMIVLVHTRIFEYTTYIRVHSYLYTHRRSVIEANEAVAYPVFGHAVELWGKLRQKFDLTNILPTQFWTSRTFCLPSFERHATPMSILYSYK